MARRRSSLVFPLVSVLTLGLAPFYPHPHIWKQLANLVHGRLVAPIDVFDLLLHGAPWVWLGAALAGRRRASRASQAARAPG